MEEQVAFGLDLAGYSTGKSGLAKAVRKGNHIKVTIYRNHAFAVASKGTKLLSEVTQKEIDLLSYCCRNAKIYIDIPIDLQGLNEPDIAEMVWQLTKRSVDYAFSALPPLADKIGSPVARIQNLIRKYDSTNTEKSPVGEDIFETYPAGSLSLLGYPDSGYKGQRISYIDGIWNGDVLAEIANNLNLKADPDTMLNDDDVDACLCALTGVASENHLLQGASLNSEISKRIRKKLPSSLFSRVSTVPPSGYVLLKGWDENLEIQVDVADKICV